MSSTVCWVGRASLVLIGGDPGRKHPLLLASIYPAFSSGHRPLCQRKESAEQIKLPKRLVILTAILSLRRDQYAKNIRTRLRIKPDFLIIDSIQTVMSPEIPVFKGSVSQVREVTAELMQLAKTNNTALSLVTQPRRNLAGPRTLEHIVDAVLLRANVKHFPYLRSSQEPLWLNQEIGILRCNLAG